ncbi:PQQ-dependent sugar dehydrogenase [Cellulomonas sp. URHD0024]|uniref:PQQ-dependent sugar dehydrogenase n=1 Tax=Cellulomonas sp. URHD0024 TaxID=1302620 RepID=UPI00042611AB|nr:PQQ-dependent sugar dehydrogenase [Cellulomonas sp. URHD0024]
MRWTARRILVALVAVVALVVSLAGPASAAVVAGPAPIVGVGSGRCLDVDGAARTAKTGVSIYDCHGGANQAWSLTTNGELQVYDAATCLDVAGNDTTAPAVVQIYPCNGGQNQKWALQANGSIVGVQSGLCLDVSGRGTANGSDVILWTCNGQTNQSWTTALRTSDTTAPTVPGNPRISNLTCTTVTFSWNASTDAVGVAFYDVYHDGQLMTSVSGSTLSANLTVVPGVTWGLFVNARDAAGNVSQASTTVPVTPPQCQVDTQAPTAPGKPTASVSGTTVTLTWAASTDNTGVRTYTVLRGGAAVGTVTGTATVPPATTFVDSGLAATTAYTYSVVARDAQGNASAASPSTTVTTGGACGTSVCGVTQVGTDTDIPWGLATLPDGSILYTRRDAQTVARLVPSTGVTTTVGTVPNVQSTDGEGGLLGLVLSPTFASDHWVYLMHTSPSDNRIVRIKLENNVLVTSSEQVLLSGILRNKFHDGGRLRFGPDGKLYASTGDAQNGDNAQNVSGLNGKILRLNPDGSVPSDNPFGNYVWSYGHRNPQGLAFDSQGRLWEQEFGNSVMDETNLITKGGNYGWPACEGTSGTCGTAGFIAPKRTYPTAEGSCSGIAIVRDVLYVACERGARLYREVISGTSLTDVQVFFNGTYGRLRTVEPAPDGGLWLTTSTLGDKDSTPNNSNERIFHVTLGG